MSAFHRTMWWAVRPLRAWRLARFFLRSLWLAAVFALGAWLWAQWSGRAMLWSGLAVPAALVFFSLFGLLALWPVPAELVARRLDRLFGLRDQLTTASEVARRGPQNYLESHLLEGAGVTLAEARHRFVRTLRIPWTDLELAVLAVAAAVAAYFWFEAQARPEPPVIRTASYQALPPVAAEPATTLPGVPPEIQRSEISQVASEGFAGLPPDMLQATTAQELLDALTEALQEPSITRGAAAELGQGDAEAAAAELRELAENAEALSPEARAALAESLRAAAERMDRTSPEVAEQLRELAGALSNTEAEGGQQGFDAATAEALERLAQLVEDASGQRSAPSSEQQAGGSGEAAGGGEEAQGEGESGTAEGQETDEGATSAESAGGAGAGAGDSGASREEGSTGNVANLLAPGELVEMPHTETLDPGSLRPPEQPGQVYQRRFVPYSYLGASGAGGDQDSDPLSTPWRLRNVIQRYFSER